MCDPVSLVVGAVAGAAYSGAKAKKGSGGGVAYNSEEERLKAEADAASSANRKLAADQRRRREQQSLVSRGAPQPSLGDEQSDADGLFRPLAGAVGLRRSQARAVSSLISRGGAPRGSAPGGGSSGGRLESSTL